MSFKPVDATIIMVVGPIIDDTDFKTLEEAIAYDAAGMDVSLIIEKTDGTTSVTVITLTTGGTSDWTHKDGGYYEIEVTAAQNAEEGIAYIRGICTGVLPFESPRYSIVKANVYDSLVKGTDVLQTDVTQLAGVAQSLTDLKDFADDGYDSNTNKITGTADMRGTDSANIVVPDAAGVTPSAVEIRIEMDTNSTKMAPSQTLNDYKADVSALALASGVDITHIHGSALTETIDGYLAAAFVKLFNVATPLLVASDVMRGTENAALAATALTDVTWTDAKAAFINASIAAIPTTAMRGTDNAALATTALSDAVWTNTKAAFLDHSIATVDTVVDGIQSDLNNPGQYKADVSALALESTVEARTLLAANYFDPSNDTVANVTTVGTTTTNTDMRGTDEAALATALADVQADLDNPSQYMANISTLVTSTELSTHDSKLDTVDINIDAILEDTGITLETHLTDIKGTGFIKDIDSLPQCLTAVGFSTHDVDAIQTALEADDGKLYAVYAALLNKMTVTSTLMRIYKDDAITLLNELTLSDDDTTVTRV